MTQQPPQAPQGDPGNASPPSGWSPAPLSQGGRPSFGSASQQPQEPGTPLGSSPLPQVTIEGYAPPKSRLPLLVVVIALGVAALIWAGTGLRAPAPSPSPSPSAAPRSTPAGSGLPFETPDGRYNGRWEIVTHRWTDSGLEAEIRISADHGPVSYSFAAFGNDDLRSTAAEPGHQEPLFSGDPIPSGSDETGWVFFPLRRGTSTILLATGAGRQMSALSVAG